MKYALPLVIAFVVGLVSTTVVVVVRTPPEASAPGGSVATTAGSGRDTSAAPVPAPLAAPVSARLPVPDSTHRAVNAHSVAHAELSPPISPARSVAPPPVTEDPAAQEQALRQLARVYSAMKPAEAAAVFARLDDARVANILSHLGARQAGSILGKLPRDRAARLSEVLLKPVRSGS